MLDWFLAPFQYNFMRTAALAGVLVSLTCASLGAYVVLRRMAFIGDALAHTVLPGLVIAYLNRWNMTIGAVLAGIATALGIGWLSRRREVREDTAIGILFTGMFALGILLMSSVRSFRDFTHMLFGYIVGVTDAQLRLFALIALVVLVVLMLLHKELELTSFDPTHAEVIGLRPDRLRDVLLVLMALAVVGAIQAVGVVLTSALLIVPAAAAAMLTRRLAPMMVFASVIAVLATLVGLLASYHLDVSSGATIVLTCIVCFLAAWGLRTLREQLSRTRRASRA
ncbi:MAG: metal ABC transporter permease [Chloroflexi bacterium]|uniref:Manganese ABC transporter permease n=1 Tax=Candidatus Thermofonsia Clade 3 bacterium TaxID=2364212 RepID=A0A2M8QE57_9CHLR|nr:MAG: manganese ABC transporter permease [Candidatus Thermofonsia Clade 3 bacterium]RMG63727.1 MAG: metal ABC transporter permease [Chloroflexota bacterium]